MGLQRELREAQAKLCALETVVNESLLQKKVLESDLETLRRELFDKAKVHEAEKEESKVQKLLSLVCAVTTVVTPFLHIDVEICTSGATRSFEPEIGGLRKRASAA